MMNEPALSIACHICHAHFEIPIKQTLCGITSPSDLADLTITAPYTSEFAEHMDGHRFDGSFREHFLNYAESIEHIADRLTEPDS
jgi:hypothetical protein